MAISPGVDGDRAFAGLDLGAARLRGDGRAVGPHLDPVAAGTGKADASARRADLQVVGLVAVADGHRQRALGQHKIDDLVVDRGEFGPAVPGQAIGGGTNPYLGAAAPSGIDDGAAADRPVDRRRAARILAVGPQGDVAVDLGQAADPPRRVAGTCDFSAT
jgi:hypothetical protein